MELLTSEEIAIKPQKTFENQSIFLRLIIVALFGVLCFLVVNNRKLKAQNTTLQNEISKIVLRVQQNEQCQQELKALEAKSVSRQPEKLFAKLSQHTPIGRTLFNVLERADMLYRPMPKDLADNKAKLVKDGFIIDIAGDSAYVRADEYYQDGEYITYVVHTVGTSGDTPILLKKGNETLLYNQDFIYQHDCQTLQALKDNGVTDFILWRYVLLNKLYGYDYLVDGMIGCLPDFDP
jgi:hypothetical protein